MFFHYAANFRQNSSAKGFKVPPAALLQRMKDNRADFIIGMCAARKLSQRLPAEQPWMHLRAPTALIMHKRQQRIAQ
jgi:hypothetical protein